MGWWVRIDGRVVGKVIAATEGEAFAAVDAKFGCSWFFSAVEVQLRGEERWRCQSHSL